MNKLTTQKQLPKLRFHGFSGAWEKRNLLEVADFRRGSFPQPYGLRKWYDDENGFPFVQVFDVDENFKLKSSTKRRITSAAKKLSVWVGKGSIVLTIQGSIGRIALTQYDACVDRTLLIFKSFKRPVDKIFFLYVVFLLFEIEKKKAPGGTIKTITKEVLSSFNISLPLLPEQKKIAEFLSATDAWIENLRVQKENLESYKKGIMQKIFSQEVRFKDEKGKAFPKWEEKKLGEVADFYKGIGISKDDVSENGKNKCIRYGELYTDYNEIIGNIVSKTNVSKADSFLSERNDLLIPSSGETSLDISSVSCINEDGILLGGDLNVIRLQGNQNGEFFAYYLTHYKNKDIAKISQGNSVVHLYSSHLKKINLNLPSIAEQQKIASLLISIDKVIESKQHQITEAERWKKGLTRGLFV